MPQLFVARVRPAGAWHAAAVKSNLTAAVRTHLATRNAEHGTVYWMIVNEQDAQALAAGHVPETVQAMARWLCEPVETMLERKARTVRRRLARRT